MIEMVENLVRLKNTLMNVETKGNSTVIMADCIRFIDQMVEAYSAEKNTVKEVENHDEN